MKFPDEVREKQVVNDNLEQFEYKMTEAEQLKSFSRVFDPGTDISE
jgi:hypothetical protein